MLSNIFSVDQAAQVHDIYLIIYVCVETTKADDRGHTQNSLKTWDFTTFLKYLVFRLIYLIFQFQDVKNLVFRNF